MKLTHFFSLCLYFDVGERTMTEEKFQAAICKHETTLWCNFSAMVTSLFSTLTHAAGTSLHCTTPTNADPHYNLYGNVDRQNIYEILITRKIFEDWRSLLFNFCEVLKLNVAHHPSISLKSVITSLIFLNNLFWQSQTNKDENTYSAWIKQPRG